MGLRLPWTPVRQSAPCGAAAAGAPGAPVDVAPPEAVIQSAALDRWTSAARLFRRPGVAIAAAFLVFIVLAAAAPAWLTRFDPYATSPADVLREPSLGHWFGTDAVETFRMAG